MATSRHSPAEKDRMLREAFDQLKARGLTSPWVASQNPYTEIDVECRVLMSNRDFVRALDSYLRTHTGLRRAVEMLYLYSDCDVRQRALARRAGGIPRRSGARLVLG